MDLRVQYTIVGIVVFLMFLLVDGVRFAFGVLYTDLLVAFPGSKASVAWVGAVSHGVFNLSGIFSGIVVRKAGCPLTMAAGSLIASLGALFSSFATSVTQLYFTYGVLLGLGFNMATLATIDLITMQFDRRRSVVMGLAMCGGGAGGFVLNPLVRYLLDDYGWRGTLLLLSGTLLHGVLLGCLCVLAPRLNKSTTDRDGHDIHDVQEADVELTRSMLGHREQNGVMDNVEEKYEVSESFGNSLTKDAEDGDIVYHEKAAKTSDGRNKGCSLFQSIILSSCNTCTKSGIHKNIPALILLFGAFIRSFAYFIPLTYLPDFVVEKGFSPIQGAWVASLAGITSCFARILIGWLSDFRFVNRLYLYVGCIAASGVVTILCFLYNSFELIVLYAALYSLLFSGEISLTPIMTIDVSRREDGSLVMGFLMTVCAVGALFGTPTAGWLFDRTQSYDLAYSVAGGVILVSGLVLLPIQCAKRNQSEEVVVQMDAR